MPLLKAQHREERFETDITVSEAFQTLFFSQSLRAGR
jgi:hypothetical protein